MKTPETFPAEKKQDAAKAVFPLSHTVTKSQVHKQF